MIKVEIRDKIMISRRTMSSIVIESQIKNVPTPIQRAIIQCTIYSKVPIHNSKVHSVFYKKSSIRNLA